jgi:hypothetical protein
MYLLLLLSLFGTAQKEWGHLARPPTLLDVRCSPSPEPVAVYAQSTLLLPDTQCRSYTIRMWSYETFIVFETSIGRYLAVET